MLGPCAFIPISSLTFGRVGVRLLIVNNCALSIPPRPENSNPTNHMKSKFCAVICAFISACLGQTSATSVVEEKYVIEGKPTNNKDGYSVSITLKGPGGQPFVFDDDDFNALNIPYVESFTVTFEDVRELGSQRMLTEATVKGVAKIGGVEKVIYEKHVLIENRSILPKKKVDDEKPLPQPLKKRTSQSTGQILPA